ncbi:NAD(P)-binding protein [Suillus decipiens]|nr:NAD(P)-binding protein [Suillus decipiens]
MSLPTHTPVWRIKNSPQDSVVLDFSDDATFALTEEPVPHIDDGEMLVENLYISNDPAQRGWIQKGVLPERLYTAPVREGDVMAAHSIARVLALKGNATQGFKVNDLVYCLTAGWRRYAVVKTDPSACLPVMVPENVSPTAAIGLFGVPGFTAYYGLLDILKLKEGESLIVSAAAGAVGNVVVQYAKNVIKAKKVIGITGSDEKCQWIKELGADVALNYKSDTFAQDLIDATSDFVDAYFDNGSVLDQVIPRIKQNGRIAACGAISGYNKDVGKPTMGATWVEIITNRLSIQGFVVLDFMFPKDGSNRVATEAFPDIARALQRGDITLERAEDIVEVPFIDIPKVWGRLFTGANTGKLVTKLTFSA